MSDNKRLVPTCIIYVDGVRLSTACEGAFRSVKVFDTMNKIGESFITFDWHDLGDENAKDFPFNANVSIHLGYKDDVREAFNGEITALKIRHPEYGPSTYTVKVSSFLHQLDHAAHKRTFENKTPSQGIKDILSRYNLQADCDAFGPSKPYWEGGAGTDWELVSGLAKRYGRDVYSFGKKVFVRESMTAHKEDITYEWGKSLIGFRVKEDIRTQAGSVRVMGWNVIDAKGFKAARNAGDVTQKVGGGSDWTKLSKSGGSWTHNVIDSSLDDEREAGDLALCLLRERGFKYMRAEGKGEGNPKLAAGALVNVKYVGEANSGQYIAEAVAHDFSLEEGYTTDFYLKRNMLDDGFVKRISGGGTGGAGGGGGGKNGNGGTDDSQADGSGSEDKEDEEEEEDAPEFRGLKWKKDGKETDEALVDDEVALFCEVKNIGDGETVKFYIYEEGKSKDDAIGELEGEVQNGKVEAPWKVIYKGEENSSTEEEIEEKGWTIPDYYFVAEYGGVESGQSKNLDTKRKVTRQLAHKETKEIWANRKYTLFLPDGSKIMGTTDENGNIEPTSTPLGEKINFFIHKE